MYILEWPERAVVDCMWPGIPYEWSPDDLEYRRPGWNLLANIPPQLFELRITRLDELYHETLEEHIFAGLPIWESDQVADSVWLVVDPSHTLFGCAVRIRGTRAKYSFPVNWDDRPGWFECLSEEDREKRTQAMESFHLPFLDWLDVSFQRLELQMEESENSVAYFNKNQER
jgi:hypothetical protein